jgi:hypothetical protein
VVLAVMLVAVAAPPRFRRPARTWGLALLGTLVYKPMSPVQHGYLDQPLILLRSVALVVPVAWLVTAPRLRPAARLAAVGALLVTLVPGVPRFCLPRETLGAFGPLVRGEAPADPPPGFSRLYRSNGRRGRRVPVLHYPWDDYRRTLAYLRRHTGPDTRVANLLRQFPHPAVNGPAGRLTPFPAAGGCIHLWKVAPGLEAEFAAALADTPDTVVVWVPDLVGPLPELQLPRLSAVVRRAYRPEARFGRIEVWRHRATTRAQPAGPETSDVARAARGGRAGDLGNLRPDHPAVPLGGPPAPPRVPGRAGGCPGGPASPLGPDPTDATMHLR